MMMVRKSKGLGERHQKILDFIESYQRKSKHPPSIREIGENCGISSTSVVNYYLDQLEKSGHIERDRKISRGVRLSGPNPLGDLLRVPVIGRIRLVNPCRCPPLTSTTSTHDPDIAMSLMPARKSNRHLFPLKCKAR
jgi:repressor LexA